MSADVQSIMHVITGLQTGGAERMLHKLAQCIADRGIKQHVVSVTSDGPIGDALRKMQIPVTVLDANYRTFALPALRRLAAMIKRESPDALITWMYHANVIGGAAAFMARRRKHIIWNIRASALGPAERPTTRLLVRLGAPMARVLARRIIINSRAAMADHIRLGYPADMFRVIPNGFDLNVFQRVEDARSRFIQSHGLPEDSFIIGIVARYHPMKDFGTFLNAVSRLGRTARPTYFVLAGENLDESNRALSDLIEAHGVRDRCRLLGATADIPQLLSALDVFTLSSRAGESFPNVIGEAMACEVPCVATDVGGVAEIMGPTGRMVPIADSSAIAAAWRELLGLTEAERRRLGRSSRDRVKACFSLEVIVDAYIDICRGIARADGENESKRTGICAA